MMTKPAAVANLYTPTKYLRAHENTARLMSKRRKIVLHEVFESNFLPKFLSVLTEKSHIVAKHKE